MFKYLLSVTMKNRQAMINCKRKSTFEREFLPYDQYLKFIKIRRLLIRKVNLKWNDAYKLLRGQLHILNIPSSHIIEQYKLCQKLKVDMTTLRDDANLLRCSKDQLVNRILLFQEMGVKEIHAASISRFSHVMHMEMRLFKAFMGIPKDEDVAENLLKYVGPVPDGVPPLEKLSENLSANEYHERCLRWYIKWKLEISKEDEQMMRYLVHRNCRSFTLLRKLFDILKNEIGLSVEQIKKYNCLATGTPRSLRKIIDEVQTFGGVDIKKLIKDNPTLHRMNYESVVELTAQLDKFGFTNRQRLACTSILLIPKDSLIPRFENIEKTPELLVLKNRETVLNLIPRFKRVQLRLNYLDYLNIKSVTVRVLIGSSESFEKYIKTNIDNSKGKEIASLLEKLLSLDGKELLRRIRKHSYWRYVDLVSINETVNFLLKSFEPEDLLDNVQLFLYPREKVEKILKSLETINEKSEENFFYYTPKDILALALYEIEREYHFTGDGIWKHETPQLMENNLSENTQVFSDSECLESEKNDELTIEQSSTNVKNKGVNS